MSGNIRGLGAERRMEQIEVEGGEMKGKFTPFFSCGGLVLKAGSVPRFSQVPRPNDRPGLCHGDHDA